MTRLTLLAIALLGLWLGGHSDVTTVAGTGVLAFVAGWTACVSVYGLRR